MNHALPQAKEKTIEIISIRPDPESNEDPAELLSAPGDAAKVRPPAIGSCFNPLAVS
jgi:hypothetical protein